MEVILSCKVICCSHTILDSLQRSDDLPRACLLHLQTHESGSSDVFSICMPISNRRAMENRTGEGEQGEEGQGTVYKPFDDLREQKAKRLDGFRSEYTML